MTASEEEGEPHEIETRKLLNIHQAVKEARNKLRYSTNQSQRYNLQNNIDRLLRLQEEQQDVVEGFEVVAGKCPMCRQTMLFRTDILPPRLPKFIGTDGAETASSYPGDRILVNKYGYAFDDPERWDVVVFKFPGNGEMNYIKRLVGLPGETLQVYQGDLFSRPLEDRGDFQIERKPADTVAAMLQPVYDTDFEPTILHEAGWPKRWSRTNEGWQVDVQPGKLAVRQQFQVNAENADSVAWLRYRHLVPTDEDWGVAREIVETGDFDPQTKARWLEKARPQLICDFNSYNARMTLRYVRNRGLRTPHEYTGLHWVGDLAVDCEVEIQRPQGELVLDLVEAGKHFSCTIDLKTGLATLGVDDAQEYQPSAATSVNSAGSYHLRFANVDDQLLLWVDGQVVDFGDATYDVAALFGERRQMIPRTSENDAGDLSPVGLGARGASLKVTRLQVLRDIYYIATKWNDTQNKTDYQPGQFSCGSSRRDSGSSHDRQSAVVCRPGHLAPISFAPASRISHRRRSVLCHGR